MKQSKTKVIGLTGGIGSGKTTIARYLQKRGAYIINADEIGHKIILKGNRPYYEIVEFFGTDILDISTNEIDRKKLGKIVFNNKQKLQKLNEITHKTIEIEIFNEIQKAGSKNFKIIILEMAILLEAGFKHLVDEVWLVYAPYNKRLQRIIERDNISLDMAKNIISNQANQEILKNLADKVIINEELKKTELFLDEFLKNNWE